jgi:hypothetical protein
MFDYRWLLSLQSDASCVFQNRGEDMTARLADVHLTTWEGDSVNTRFVSRGCLSLLDINLETITVWVHESYPTAADIMQNH